jgi:two-component system, LytTR family, sensor kinase
MIEHLKKNALEIKWQVGLFGLYFVISMIQAYSEHPSQGILTADFFGVLNVILTECVMVNLLGNWLMVKYPFATHPKQYFSYLFLITVCFVGYKFMTAYPNYVDILKSYNGNQDKKSLVFFVFISVINVILALIVGFGIYSLKKSNRMEKRAHTLENEINHAKLNILKHQINPHFLYNTLSYMYAQARPVSDKLSKSILLLSDMMRYSLNKTDENGLTLIEKEIQYIENFIEIHRLRFNEDFCLIFEVEGIIGNKKIVPLMLITFVENAIKHGKLNDKKHPIQIKIKINKNELELLVENKKQAGKKDETSGIGLNNTRKRLELVYPNRHILDITDKADYFAVTLKIDLNAA